MTLDEKIGNWLERILETEEDTPPNREMRFGEDDEDGGNDDPEIPELLLYRELISKSLAYKWLLARLDVELTLARAESSTMRTIRECVRGSLPSSHKVSRKSSAEAFQATFKVDWDPLLFVREQEYTEEPGEAIETAITLTRPGFGNDLQAITCAQYMRQTWPWVGEHMIQLVKDVLRSGASHKHTCEF